VTEQPQLPSQQQQVQIIPWGWAFQHIADTGDGPLMAILIHRPPLERIAMLALVRDLERFHHDLGNAIAERKGGIILPGPGAQLPPPLDPTNGFRQLP
jgi:hypothetical protein